MNKKRIVQAAVAVGFVATLILGCQMNGYTLQKTVADYVNSQQEGSENATPNKTDSPKGEEVDIKQYDEVSDIIDTILESGTKEHFLEYPVDESFFLWIFANYGEEVLVDLAHGILDDDYNEQFWYEKTGCTMHVLWTNYCKDLHYSTYLWEDVIWKENAGDGRITIDVIGDINLDESWYTMQAASQMQNGVADCIDTAIQDELKSADITMINNEFVFSDRGEALQGKSYTFRTGTANVGLLECFGTDLAALANNHLYDYGEEGLLDTVSTLQRAGYATIGAGADLEEAGRIQYYVIGGRKIAFVSATEIEKYYNYTVAATENTAGVLKTQNMEYVLQKIQEANKYSDYVVVYIHWGVEGYVGYNQNQSAMAKELVTAGADVVLGGHPHRLQGVSYIEGVPIAYSLGNFWFSNGSLYTTIAQLQIDEQGELSLSMLPCVQKDMKVTLLTDPKEVDDFYYYLADVSTNVAIDANGTIYDASQQSNGEEGAQVPTEELKYFSEQHYQSLIGSVDLEGRPINIVGNLK